MLETLYMAYHDVSPLDFNNDDDDDDDSDDPPSLDIALAGYAKYLQVLSIRWDNIISPESLIGPDGRLTSLANIPSLYILYV